MDRDTTLAIRRGVWDFEEIFRAYEVECTYDTTVRKIQYRIEAVLGPNNIPHKVEICAFVLSMTNEDI